MNGSPDPDNLRGIRGVALGCLLGSLVWLGLAALLFGGFAGPLAPLPGPLAHGNPRQWTLYPNGCVELREGGVYRAWVYERGQWRICKDPRATR